MNKFILTVDIGNSKTKCCLFTRDGEILVSFPIENLEKILKNYNLNSQNSMIYYSRVKKENVNFPFTAIDVSSFFKENKFLDMPVHYNETLGIDRLVCAYFAYQQDNKAKFIIDTGSFTTVDQVDIKGFNGGYILPGLKLLSESYSQGEQLNSPDMTPPHELEQLLGTFPQNTKVAIHHGAFLSFLAPIREVLRTHSLKTILITGGNGEILLKYLKNWEFCQDASIQFDPYLVHKGLFEIAKRTI